MVHSGQINYLPFVSTNKWIRWSENSSIPWLECPLPPLLTSPLSLLTPFFSHYSIHSDLSSDITYTDNAVRLRNSILFSYYSVPRSLSSKHSPSNHHSIIPFYLHHTSIQHQIRHTLFILVNWSSTLVAKRLKMKGIEEKDLHPNHIHSQKVHNYFCESPVVTKTLRTRNHIKFHSTFIRTLTRVFTP